MTASSTVLWTMLTDAATAFTLVRGAAGEAGFRTESHNANEVFVDIPRSLRRRRRASRLTGSASPAGRRTEIVWTSADPHSELYEHLLGIEENLPAGFMYHHGLSNAADRAGFPFPGTRSTRDVVRHLHRNELVRAAGQGHLNDQPGFVVLTDERFLFVTNHIARSELVMDMPCSSAVALSLGKRVSGETLTISVDGRTVDISRLGHGEGHGIATSFRKALLERARANPLHNSDHSLPRGSTGTQSLIPEP